MSIEAIYQLFSASEGVCTDTRQIRPGVLFFALRGASFNGNEFAAAALEQGASYAIIDDENHKVNNRCVLVQDALACLQELARYHRRRFSIPFIAVTGSNGKTTTKELIYSVLATTYKTYATKGNLNNHIGIPLTLLSIKEDAQIAIIEMGANHQKEIESYCRIAEPTHGIITNIGKAHLEGFGGLEGVKKGKGELFAYLKARSGTAFVNSSNSLIMELDRPEKSVYFPQANDDYSCSLEEANPYIRFKAANGERTSTQLIGKYNFDNIAAALCIARHFAVPDTEANRAISAYVPDNNRSQVIRQGDNTILLDAYNANPSSMQAALENFAGLPGEGKVVILGDMFELGDESEAEHERLGGLIREKHFDTILLCGTQMAHASRACPEALYFEDRPSLENFLISSSFSQTRILIKGSRSMGLEKILPLL